MMAKPLFDGQLFNRSGKRTRVKFLKTISCEETSYDLYIRDTASLENSFPQAEDDKYYLQLLMDGWLIPLSMTERFLRQHAVRKPLAVQMYGSEAAREDFYNSIRKSHADSEADRLIADQLQKEASFELALGKSGKYQAEYIRDMLDGHIQSYLACKEGTGGYPNFIGALLVNELDHCIHLSNLRIQASEEKARQIAIAKAKQHEAELADAEEAFLTEKTVIGANIIFSLAQKYNVTIPSRTAGWIHSNFIDCHIKDSRIYVRYKRGKGGTCSTRIHDVIWSIYSAIQKASTKEAANGESAL